MKLAARNALVLLMAVSVALLGALHLNGLLEPYGDNGHYIILAQSILRGAGYADVLHPGSPPHGQYPPAFSVLLVPLVWAAGVHVVLLKTVALACGVLAVVVIYSLIRRLSSPWVALSVVALTGSSPLYIEFATDVMSEVPYLLFAAAAILFLHESLHQERILTRASLLGAAFLLLASFTRSIGVTLLAALFCFVLVEQRMKRGLLRLGFLVAPSLVCLAAWFLRATIYVEDLFLKDPDRDEGAVGLIALLRQAAFDRLPEYVERLLPRVAVDTRVLIDIMGIGDATWVVRPVSWIAFLGFAARALRKRTLLEYYVLLYLAAAVLWPWVMLRLLLPVLPFVMFYFVTGLCHVARASAVLIERLQRSRGLSYLSLSTAACISVFLLVRKSEIPVVFGRWSWLAWASCLFSLLLLALLLVALFRPSLSKRIVTSPATLIPILISPVVALNLAGVLRPPFGVVYATEWEGYYEASLFLKESAPADSIVMCRSPRMTYVWGERQVVRIPRRSMDRKEVRDFMAENDVDYVITAQVATGPDFDWPCIIPVLESDGVSELVFSAKGARVYKVLK